MEWNQLLARIDRLDSHLTKLYLNGNLKLSELQSLREILNEFRSMIAKLNSTKTLLAGNVKKDKDRLCSEFLLMEYNVSLISSSEFQCA